MSNVDQSDRIHYPSICNKKGKYTHINYSTCLKKNLLIFISIIHILIFFSGNKLIKKWRNIRDSYSRNTKRSTKSGQAADVNKKYIYARQLSFLGYSGASTETQSSLAQEDENQCEETVESEGSDRPKYDQRSSLKRKRNVESALIDFMTKPMPTPPPVSEPDPDRSFFESVLPSIRKFDEDQKIQFRCEVLKIIQRMRNIHQPNFPSHTYPPNPYLHQSIFPSSQNLRSSQSYPLPPQSTSTNYLTIIPPQTPFPQQMTELRPVASLSSSDFSIVNIKSPNDGTSQDQDESIDLFP